MKKFLGTFTLSLLFMGLFAQSKKSLSGRIIDRNTKTPVAAATIVAGNQQSLSNEDGAFSIVVSGNNQVIRISSLGYRDAEVLASGNALTVELEPSSLFLQPLEVRSIRASDKAPFAKTNLDKTEITNRNLGQDIPFLLNQTPSVVVNSDAGNGVGYTGIRIRGTDATRINVTLNGIPYNDAESMGTFFVNLPDFSSSVNSIQVQRGVGTSSNGASAFGATINLSTNEFNEKPYAELNNSFGSFTTFKNTLKVGSGLMGKHFTLDARLSSITSNGYIDRATSDLKSFYLSGAWLSEKSSLRLNVFSGKERTYQAWYGVAESLLKTDRTNNPAGTEKPGTPYDDQTDNYTQTHYQLFFNHAFNPRWSLQTAAFLTRGYGYYEEYKADEDYSDYGLTAPVGSTVTDLVRQRWLNNYFYGQTGSLQYKHKRTEFTLGGGWSTYTGDHYGTIPWIEQGTVPAGYRYYMNPAIKKDANVYIKWQQQIGKYWYTFADLQYRHVSHRMNGFRENPSLLVNRAFDFVNPKAGISFKKKAWQVYLSYALGQKEPNRDDFEAGTTRQPKHEIMHDVELGAEWKKEGFQWVANVYYMYYINQLVLNGQINDVGAFPRINVPYSYRLGIELQASWKLIDQLTVGGNLALSRNKISSFTEYVDNYDTNGQSAFQRRNTDISFSPQLVAGSQIQYTPGSNWEFSLLGKYVSRQYMDNTQLVSRSLKPFSTQDLRIIYQFSNRLFKQLQVIAQVNNLFNVRYEPNGYTYSYISSGTLSTDNGYYPMAGTNFMLGVNLKF
jgi:iron complex outermembrane receptor protein